MNSPQEQQQIRQQAAEWAIRLDGGDLDRSRREALDGWLAADPRHPAALALAQRTWKQLGSLAEPRTMVQTAVASAPRRAGGRRKGWRGWAAAAAVLLALGSAWNERDAGVSWLADHATGKGEVRILRLVDGSEVELDAQSAIDVAYDSRERRVRLLEGSAIFRAAPRAGRETRPFVVESAGGSTRALGTRFLVSRNDDGSVQVGVLEHRVAVALAHPRTGTVGRRELGEGESLRYSAEGGAACWSSTSSRWARWWRASIATGRGICWWLPVRWRSGGSAGYSGSPTWRPRCSRSAMSWACAAWAWRE